MEGLQWCKEADIAPSSHQADTVDHTSHIAGLPAPRGLTITMYNTNRRHYLHARASIAPSQACHHCCSPTTNIFETVSLKSKSPASWTHAVFAKNHIPTRANLFYSQNVDIFSVSPASEHGLIAGSKTPTRARRVGKCSSGFPVLVT